MLADRPDRDGSRRPVTTVTDGDTLQFGIDFENIHGGVMACGENVGGSSRSGRIVTIRHYGYGW